jgi:hypothetical protein
LSKYHRMERFDGIWKSSPAYLDIPSPTKAYSEVSQWTGKEMRRWQKHLVATLKASLTSPKAAEEGPFNQAIRCIRALVEFSFYSRYDFHDELTLGYMEEALVTFHKEKVVFLPWQTKKKSESQIKAAEVKYRLQRDAAQDDLKAQGKSAAFRKRDYDSWNTFIDGKSDDARQNLGDFNFPKIHLLTHFQEQIEYFVTLKQWSTDNLEVQHRAIKAGYRAGNRNPGNYELQFLNYLARQEAFAVRRRNIVALQRRRGWNGRPLDAANDEAGAVRASPVPSAVLPPARKVLNGMYERKQIGKILQLNTELDSEEVIDIAWKHPRVKNGFVSKESLSKAWVTQFKTIELPVQDFATLKWSIQKVRSTGLLSWIAAAPRNDWVWVETDSAQRDNPNASARYSQGQYGALHGRLPARLCCLFKLMLPPQANSSSQSQVTLHLALIAGTRAVNAGNPEAHSGLVKVEKNSGKPYEIISAIRISGAAHMLPEIPDEWEKDNRYWWINSMIDFTTWNTVYKWSE